MAMRPRLAAWSFLLICKCFPICSTRAVRVATWKEDDPQSPAWWSTEGGEVGSGTQHGDTLVPLSCHTHPQEKHIRPPGTGVWGQFSLACVCLVLGYTREVNILLVVVCLPASGQQRPEGE